jgi:hypothetical protein
MDEHAVIATYRLSDDDFGSEEEWEGIHLLERRLAAAIDAAGVGEFDGNVFGGGEVTLYAYGPDGDALFAVMAGPLREHPLRPASVLLRYGEAGDPRAREVSVEL